MRGILAEGAQVVQRRHVGGATRHDRGDRAASRRGPQLAGTNRTAVSPPSSVHAPPTRRIDPSPRTAVEPP